MATVVADLIARVRAEGVEQTAQQVKAVGDQAAITARALENMAAAYSKQLGGTPAQALEMFQRSGAVPNAAAMSQAAQELQKVAGAHGEAAQAAQRTSTAIAASVAPTRALASAAAEHAKGWTASESSLLRFGSALVGINLGISLIAGSARLIHQTISGVVDAQLNWERSIGTVRGLYGALGSQIAQTAQQQAQAPGLLGTNQEFIDAQLNASYLARRYGVSPAALTALTSSAGAVSFTLGYNEDQRRAQQAAALAFAEGGGSSLRNIGVEGDPLSIARAVGLQSPASLQAFTPQQLRDVQTQIAIQGQSRFALFGEQQNGLLSRDTQLQQQLTQTRSRLQSVAQIGGFRVVEAGDVQGYAAAEEGTKALEAELAKNSQAIGDNTTRLAASTVALEKLGVTAGSATARLLGFTGNIEDTYSIARGDIGAQAQAAVAARARSAIPLIGQTQGERTAVATNTGYQQVYQNYVAQQAQNSQDNAIREFFENQVQYGPAANRAAAQRALDQGPQLTQINSRIAEAQKAGGLVDMATAETQARLEQISLTQRERYVQLMRDTVDLRKLDVQQQQASIAAGQDVIRATQAALPAQYALSNAQYEGSLAGALARQRLGRTLRGQSVAGLPSIDDLIKMNVNAQFDQAEAGPAALIGARGVEMAQRTATSAGLAQQLTAGQLQGADLANDLKNLGDLPSQTALMLEDVQNSRDQLAVQKELRDLTKDLVRIMTGRPSSATSGQGMQDLNTRLGQLLFGDDSSGPAAPPDLPGNRRGPS